jgi:hypothetical protein
VPSGCLHLLARGFSRKSDERLKRVHLARPIE